MRAPVSGRYPRLQFELTILALTLTASPLAGCSSPECPPGKKLLANQCVRIARTADAGSDEADEDDDVESASKRDAGRGTLDAVVEAKEDASNLPDAAALDTPSKSDAATPSCVVEAEKCDGKDDDCDGVVDDGVTNACGGCDAIEPSHGVGKTCDNGGKGPCAKPGTWECHAGTTVCTAPDPTPSDEVCDGKDNDCDGVVDNGITKNSCGGCDPLPHNKGDACDNGLQGECFLKGTWTCGADSESITCSAKPKAASAEICDGKDNDCNGATDDQASDTKRWYRDCDADGYAATADAAQTSCAKPAAAGACRDWTNRAPVGFTTIDCNDDNPAYHPGADFGIPSGNSQSGDLNCDGRAEALPTLTNEDGTEFNVCALWDACDCYRPINRNGKYLQDWADWTTKQGSSPHPVIPCSVNSDDKLTTWKKTSGPDKAVAGAECAAAGPLGGMFTTWLTLQRCR